MVPGEGEASYEPLLAKGMLLCPCYAMSSTVVENGTYSLLRSHYARVWHYQSAMRCPVLTWSLVLPFYAMSGTDIRVRHYRCSAMSGTDIRVRHYRCYAMSGTEIQPFSLPVSADTREYPVSLIEEHKRAVRRLRSDYAMSDRCFHVICGGCRCGLEAGDVADAVKPPPNQLLNTVLSVQFVREVWVVGLDLDVAPRSCVEVLTTRECTGRGRDSSVFYWIMMWT
eukprot:3940578-Rhodomonas_salina.1